MRCVKEKGLSSSFEVGIPKRRYASPSGFVRFGLKINLAVAAVHNIFKNWHVTYHGTTFPNLKPIFDGGLVLLKPGDKKLGGKDLELATGHVSRCFLRHNLFTGKMETFDPNQVFTTPSSRYASHPAYAREHTVDNPLKSGQVSLRFIFECRQRPGSYDIGQETVGARDIVLDPLFRNSELEFYTKENSAIVITALLIQISIRS